MKKKKLSDRVADYVITASDDDLATLKVDTIAEKLGVNPSYLSRKFKSDKEMTLNEFITGEKMHRSALTLGKNKKISIVNLAKSTGFARADYFVILFKNFYGIHPKRFSELRESMSFRPADYN